MSKVTKDFTSAIKDASKSKTSGYDTTATVKRIEGQTAWVHIPGGVDETPVRMTIAASVGDSVQVRVSNGSAFLVGNGSAPPTDDKTANTAIYIASSAKEESEIAHKAAEDAVASAAMASQAANSAQESALAAAAQADIAQNEASLANKYANGALTQLSVVEGVLGTLNWVSEHATYKASQDTEVMPGKLYFTKSGNMYTPVANPTGNPSTSGYYEIDSITEAVSNYVASHLSLTNDGLWVLNDNNSYKILLSSTGMKVYDASGVLVSTFGESIVFGSTRTQVIGGESNYIMFDPNDGSITINGSNVKIGNTGKKLSEVLTDIDVSVTQTASGADITINGDTVSLSNGADGATGPQGEQGPQGETGATGPSGPEALVTITASDVDCGSKTATLTAVLRVDGTVTTPTGYVWTKGTDTTSLGTSQSITIDGETLTADGVYNCKVTWPGGTQTGSFDIQTFISVYENAGAYTNEAADIVRDEIPQSISELPNDSGYITSQDVPTQLSELDGYDTLNEQIDGLSTDIANTEEALSGQISETNVTVNNLVQRAEVVDSAVIIDPNEPSVTVVRDPSRVKITNEAIELKGGSNATTYITPNGLETTTMTAQDFHPRVKVEHTENNVTTVEDIGPFIFMARENGNFSLKKSR